MSLLMNKMLGEKEIILCRLIKSDDLCALIFRIHLYIIKQNIESFVLNWFKKYTVLSLIINTVYIFFMVHVT